MQLIANLTFVYIVAIVVVGGWIVMDMRSILREAQRRKQLAIDGRWKELEEHFEQASNPRRPFVWLQKRFLLPGGIQVQHALFLFKQGRLEEALAKVDQAIRQIKKKPKIFSSVYKMATVKILAGAFNARTLILTGMGRYDEARQTIAESMRLDKPGKPNNTPLALLEYDCGRLDEALALAQTVPPNNPHYDTMRVIGALALYMKGEFDQALQALMYEPGDVSKFYSPESLKTMLANPEGAKLIELQNKKIAGVRQPARLILIAKMHIARKDFPSADRALDEAEKKLGSEPGIQMSYCRYRALSFAAQGKPLETGDYVERLRRTVKERPKRSLLWETHFVTGQTCFYLGQLGDALAEFEKARSLALHPVEKHPTAYWIGHVYEAMGDLSKAVPCYQAVVADGIPTWMSKNAAESLARANN